MNWRSWTFPPFRAHPATRPSGRARSWGILLGGCLLLAILSGCRSISFYAQAVRGQYQLITWQKPIAKILADPQTPADLRDRLRLVQDLRAFARQQLQLPVDGHYLKYADVHRPFVVWNVEAAPEFSLEPKTWWYPLVGRQEYRGYFSKPAATNYAATLRQGGYDVTVGGVPAYSTLGWFKDPVLNTFLFEPEAELAETLFHELGHQVVFASGDTDFNEAFATTVGETGARRWLQAKGDTNGLARYEAHLRRTGQFVHLVQATRHRLAALYQDEPNAKGKLKATRHPRTLAPDELRRQKNIVLQELRQDYARLKKNWDGNPEFDGWFAAEINNAQLNSVANYYEWVPGFQRLLAQNGDDLPKFYHAAGQWARKPRAQRLKLLQGAKPN